MKGKLIKVIVGVVTLGFVGAVALSSSIDVVAAPQYGPTKEEREIAKEQQKEERQQESVDYYAYVSVRPETDEAKLTMPVFSQIIEANKQYELEMQNSQYQQEIAFQSFQNDVQKISLDYRKQIEEMFKLYLAQQNAAMQNYMAQMDAIMGMFQN